MRLLILITLLPTLVVCQNIDSLKARVNAAPEGEQFEMILSYMRNLMKKDAQLAYNVSPYAIEYAKKSGDSLLITKAYFAQGFLLNKLEMQDSALVALRHAYGVATRNNQIEQLYKISSSMGILYTFTAKYDKALKAHFEALSLSKKLENIEDVSVTCNNIGLIYYKLYNSNEALKFYNQSLKAKKEIDSYFDLDRLYINMSLCFNQLRRYEAAEESIKLAFAACENKCTDQIKMEAEISLGISLLERNFFIESSKHFERGLSLARQLNNSRFELDYLYHIASLNLEQGNLKKALSILQDTEIIATSFDYPESLLDIFKELSTIHAKMGDYKKSASYSEKYNNLRDSIYSAEMITNLAVAEVEFAERENKARIAHQEQVLKLQEDSLLRQKIIIVLVSISALLLIALATLLYYKSRARKQANMLLESKVQERTYQLRESHAAILRQAEERSKEVSMAYNGLAALRATIKGVIHIGKKETDQLSVSECFEEVDRAVDKIAEIANHHLTDKR